MGNPKKAAPEDLGEIEKTETGYRVRPPNSPKFVGLDSVIVEENADGLITVYPQIVVSDGSYRWQGSILDSKFVAGLRMKKAPKKTKAASKKKSEPNPVAE